MLDKLFAKPTELTIGDQTIGFLSIVDFEFCLSGRTSVPSSKITHLMKCTRKQLQAEAHTIKDIEKRFVSMLFRSIEEPSSISHSFKELDTSIFSRDHAWRNIITALNDGDNELDPFRRIALVKYMQYLSSRQSIINSLYSEKKKPVAKKTKKSDKQNGTDPFAETLIFESMLFEPNSNVSFYGKLVRMPKGEPVIATPGANEHIIVMLSKHKCEIAANGQIFFIDQIGRKHVLDMGRNSIGRDTSGTVIIDSDLRDISRLHLVVENLGNNSLKLTDLSAYGTYIPSALLEDRSN